MNANQIKNQLAQVFEQDYQGYDYFVEQVINLIFTGDDAYEALHSPDDFLTDENKRQRANEIGILRIVKTGTIETEEPIDLFDITLSDKKELQYNRVGIQQFIRSELFPFTNAFMLFHNETTEGKDWRFSFAYKETTIKGMTPAKRYTYLFGKSHRARTASERFAKLADEEKTTQNLLDAFSVEALSKSFFDEYKSRYKDFCEFLFANKNDTEYFGSEFSQWEDKFLRDYVKKMMGRITFIYFLQRKGWMNGNLEYMQIAFKQSLYKDNYLDEFLEPLFFGVLNTKPEERKALFEKEGWALSLLDEWKDVPYLNGGLFERDEQDEPKSKFPAELFNGLFDFYSRYNFTIDENDPDDAEVGVDPEMLGHIFENLLEDNKDKGAFYTPKEIVQYMSQESIAQYLKTHTEEALHPAIDELIKEKKVNDLLQNKAVASAVYALLQEVKVCDPAIGSGAFPMGVLNVLYHARLLLYGFTKPTQEFSPAEVKREIIQNNIYGVDIEKGAIDIARLRFWLALVVDETYPEPLPNLDFKIMQGNSLLEQFEGVDLKDLLPKANEDGLLIVFDEETQLQTILNAKQLDYFSTTDHEEKQRLRNEIIKVVKDLIIERTQGKNELHAKLQPLDLAENDQFFLWHTWFADVFKNGGFDVVIGNPPYGAKLSPSEKRIYKELYSDVHMRTPETFCYFTSLAFRLCNKASSAVVSYIVPNNIFFQNENEKTRELLSLENMLVRAINLGDNTFENADVPTCIFVAKAKKEKKYDIAYSDYRDYNVKKIEWDKSIEHIQVEKLQTVPAMVIGMSNTDIDILNAIRNNGITIDYIAEEMASGISTGGDRIFKIDVDTINNHSIEFSLLKPVLVGSDINKYRIDYSGDKIIYTTRETNISEYPFTKDYLYQFIDKLSQRSECKKGILPWFALNRNRYEGLFVDPKIIMRQTSDSIITTFDSNGYFVLDSILVLKLKEGLNYRYKFISAILNSKIVDYLYKILTQEEGRTFAQVKPINVRKLYVPNATKSEQNLISTLYDYMAYLRNPQMQSVDGVISNQFIGDFFERIIDGCVFEMFFREHMKERGINVIDFLYDMIKPIDNVQETSDAIAPVFNTLYKTDNEVRTRMNLFVSRSPEYLKTIIQS